MNNITNKIKKILGSHWFFAAIVAFFVIQAAYIALSGRFPMAFDEDFHLGIIQLYSHQLSPFFAHQPANANQFGAVVRDPSYLYHYLMSFPYRLSAHFIKSATVNIIILRFFSIAFFTAALIIFKRIFTRFLKVSQPLSNVVLLFFIITPIVPLLAAQINYDNLLILFVAIDLWLLFKFIEIFKKKGQIDFSSLLLLLGACFFSSLVKYSFLPIFLAIGVYLIYVFAKRYWSDKAKFKKSIKAGLSNFNKHALPAKLAVLIFFILGLGLFIERDGYNTLRYHTPAPQCNVVLSVNTCKAYSPWYRNYVFTQSKSPDFDDNAFSFSTQWFHQYFDYSLFYALNGLDSGYSVGGPMPIPQVVGQIIFWSGLLLTLVFFNKIFRRNIFMPILALVVFIYTLSLWTQNYSDYKNIGQAVAEQGRYLVIVLPLAYLIVAKAINELVNKLKQADIKPILAVGTIVLFLQGGGITTYILTSDATWYWNNDNVAVKVNHAANKILRHVIVHPKNT